MHASADSEDLPPVRFTPAQAAAIVGGVNPVTRQPHFSRRFVLDAYRAGRVEGTRIGGRILFTHGQLAAWADSEGFGPLPAKDGDQ